MYRILPLFLQNPWRPFPVIFLTAEPSTTPLAPHKTARRRTRNCRRDASSVASYLRRTGAAPCSDLVRKQREEVGVGANTGGDACGATRRAPGVEWRGRVGGASNAAEPGKAANRV